MSAGLNSDKDSICATGVGGLDIILGGGLPSACFYLLQGDPGSGKTTLALQFLLEGVRRGEPTLYITLSETKNELLKVARSHGWSLDKIALLELSAVESLLQPEAQSTVFHPAEMQLSQVSEIIQNEVARVKPSRLVFDSLSEFRLIAETPLRYRRQLLALKQEFARCGCTVLLLDDKMDNGGLRADPHVLSLAHGVVEMEQRSPDYGVSRRRLRVMKMRGVKFREGYHDYVIATGGLRVFPRLVAAEHHADFKREPASSGLPQLDELLGGGLDRGTTTLIAGQAGTGKSTLALQYVSARAAAGERCAVFTFDETLGILLKRASTLGLDFDRHVQSGTITAQQVDPAELSPGEFAVRVADQVQNGCKVIVIDSLNGYMQAMPGEKYLLNQLHELAAFLNQQGILTILVMAHHGMAGDSPLDLSYLADNIISTRFFEVSGTVKQALSVLKKRSGDHEKTIREFRLEKGKGIFIGEPLTEFQGVLSGLPVFTGSVQQIINSSNAPQ